MNDCFIEIYLIDCEMVNWFGCCLFVCLFVLSFVCLFFWLFGCLVTWLFALLVDKLLDWLVVWCLVYPFIFFISEEF